MNFTREPIIETIITPKDGFRLTIRSSKGQSQEEYSVEALEVVSFGHAHFFRSLEKPKSFLLPITDYEVVETRETKIVLKNPQIDKTIKIAGGKEPQLKIQSKEVATYENSEASGETQEEEKENTFEKRKDKKKNRRKKAQENRHLEKETEQKSEEKTSNEPSIRKEPLEENSVQPPLFSSLLPPPTTLISETIGRYKAMESSENFMHVKETDKTETTNVESDAVELSQIANSGEDELDEIWAHKQSEETFSFAETSQVDLANEDKVETTEHKINDQIVEDAIDDDKPLEMDVDKFIE